MPLRQLIKRFFLVIILITGKALNLDSLREKQKFLVHPQSQWPSAQNNSLAKVVHLGETYSEPLQYILDIEQMFGFLFLFL